MHLRGTAGWRRKGKGSEDREGNEGKVGVWRRRMFEKEREVEGEEMGE
jgi:hypothetical protein